MEWIKAKYDRLLLGLCALIALVVGGLLLMKAVGFKKTLVTGPQGIPVERNDLGANTAESNLALALTRLKEVAEVKPPKLGEVDISLFTAAPVVKKVGEAEPLPVDGPKLIRPPVKNRWLFDYGLDLLRADILDVDSDDDHFTNLEEYNADPKTNPMDAKSHPLAASKIQYKELIQEPLSVKFNTYVNDKELTFRVTGATPESAFNTRDLVVGGSFPVERGGTEMRFKLIKVDATIEGKEKAILEDLKNGNKKVEITMKEDMKFPTNRAKLVSTLGKEEEKIVGKGDEISFEADPEQTYTVTDVTEAAVTLEFTPKGGTEKKTLTINIPPPP